MSKICLLIPYTFTQPFYKVPELLSIQTLHPRGSPLPCSRVARVCNSVQRPCARSAPISSTLHFKLVHTVRMSKPLHDVQHHSITQLCALLPRSSMHQSSSLLIYSVRTSFPIASGSRLSSIIISKFLLHTSLLVIPLILATSSSHLTAHW